MSFQFHIFIHTALIVWLSACYQNFAPAKHNFSVIIIDRGLGSTDFWCFKRHRVDGLGLRMTWRLLGTGGMCLFFIHFWQKLKFIWPLSRETSHPVDVWYQKVWKSIVNLWLYCGQAALHHFHVTFFVACIRKAILFSLVTTSKSNWAWN